jgi:hypothetical protein
VISPAQFQRVTGEKEFPACVAGALRDGKLECYANSSVTYRLREWRTESVSFPLRASRYAVLAESRAWLAGTNQADGVRVYKGAMRLAFVERLDRPVGISSLQLGGVIIVNLPGEPMLAFQRFAQSLRLDQFVAVAGYGDCGPAYICTDQALAEGGYEPGSANVGRESERALQDAIRRLLPVAATPKTGSAP